MVQRLQNCKNKSGDQPERLIPGFELFAGNWLSQVLMIRNSTRRFF